MVGFQEEVGDDDFRPMNAVLDLETLQVHQMKAVRELNLMQKTVCKVRDAMCPHNLEILMSATWDVRGIAVAFKREH